MDFEVCKQLLELNGFRETGPDLRDGKRIPVHGRSQAWTVRRNFAREFEDKQQQVAIFQPQVLRSILGLRPANVYEEQLEAIRFTNKSRIRNLKLDVPMEIIEILGLCP